MESISAVHGKKGAVDHGNYVPTPLVSGVKVADGQTLRKVFVLSGAQPCLPPEGILVGADAVLDLVVIVLPGTSARIPMTIDLAGEGSRVKLSGIYVCSGSDEVAFDITMNHRVGHCWSDQIFNGLAAGKSKCGFFGKIVVAPDAQKTEAFQTNHNILLSDEARVNAKPRLEIYADDVKCSHGASVGKLSEEEQFYMRSRGIPEEEAKVLQMISFVAPVLESVPEEEREALAAKVEEAIRSI